MLHHRTVPGPGAPARLPEPLSETVPTLLVGPDRLGMEGLRSILRDSRFRVVESRERITRSCPPLREEAMTALILIGGSLGPAEAALCAALIRGWHADHRVLAVLDAHPDDPSLGGVFDGLIQRNSLGDQIIETLERAQADGLRRHLRARLLRIPESGAAADTGRPEGRDRASVLPGRTPPRMADLPHARPEDQAGAYGLRRAAGRWP